MTLKGEAVFTMLAILALSSCGPNFNSTDRDFERRVQAVVYERPLGTIPSDEGADVLRTLFQSNVDHVCIVGGGDFAVDVRDQWSRSEQHANHSGRTKKRGQRRREL